MKKAKRILFAMVCVALVAASWIIAVTSKKDIDLQAELVLRADRYLADGAYVRAVPLLEEAASYNTVQTLTIESRLKETYLQLLETEGYPRKYINLLEKQMARKDATEEIFVEAADFYLQMQKPGEALKIWKRGAEKLGSKMLEDLYEANRYTYRIGRERYEKVTAICNGYIQVMLEQKWGLASAAGSLVIPCEYDKISSWSNDECIVAEGETISGVDRNNNRVSLCHAEAVDFTCYNENRLWLKDKTKGWFLSDGDFQTGMIYMQAVGTYSDGASAVMYEGKWGLVKANGSEWLLEPQYDDIICDELGRSYQSERVFVRQGNTVQLLKWDKKAKTFVQVGESFEDARPFADGWAAVKKNGKWGFINKEGEMMIEPQFDDARSFGQHLAAVCQRGMWGYVSLRGEIVIDFQYFDAKSFSDGSAPVLTEYGWQFITLDELKNEGGGLL